MNRHNWLLMWKYMSKAEETDQMITDIAENMDAIPRRSFGFGCERDTRIPENDYLSFMIS